MGNPENFSKDVKLMNEAEVREILAGGKDPVGICQAAVRILSQMEKNFGEALSKTASKFSQSPYDGNIDMEEKKVYTDFEKAALELKDMEGCLLLDMGMGLSFCGIAVDDFGDPVQNFDMVINEIFSLLMTAQSFEKNKIETQLSESDAAPALRHKEFLKKLIDDEMVRIEKQHNLQDLFILGDFEGDYSKLYENLKRFDEALQSLPVDVAKLLSEYKPRILLGDIDGLAIPLSQLVVSLKWDTPQLYSEGLKEAIMQYAYFQKAQERMYEFVKSEGVELLTRNRDIYDGVCLYDAIPVFIEAYNQLTFSEKELFKKYKPRIVLGRRNGVEDMIGDDEDGISVYYKSPESFLENLKSGIHQYRCFKEVMQTLSDISKICGVEYIGLWGGDSVSFDYEDVQRNLIAFRRAVEQLSEQDLEIIKSRKLTIWLSNDSSVSGLVANGLGRLTLCLYYKDDYKKMVSVIKESIRKFEIAAVVSTQSLQPKVDEFLDDPLLKGLESFELPLEARALCKGDLEEFKIAILRNLNLKNKVHTDENIVQEAQGLVEAQERYSDVMLFKDRNVLLVFNNEEIRDREGVEGTWRYYTEQDYVAHEKIAGGKYRFGTKTFRRSVNKVAGGYEAIVPKGDTVGHLKESKRRILDAIRTTPPPFTFVFDGHGEAGSLVLMNWKKMEKVFGKERAIKVGGKKYDDLTAEEVAEAISDRYVNFPQLKDASPEQKDIFIIAACSSNNFLINVYTFLSRKVSSVSMPIIISAAEYGQYGFSDNQYYGSNFFSRVLGLSAFWSNGASESTIKTILENQSEGNSNPTIFIPIKDAPGQYMQIADKDVEDGASNSV